MAVDWTRGYGVDFEFWEVDPATLGDVRRIEDVRSAEMSWDASKASQGSATISLDHDPAGAWWRCYLVAEQGGDSVKTPLGTWCCVRGADSFGGTAHSVDVDCVSPLNEAAGTFTRPGYTVSKGSDGVAAARTLVAGASRCPVSAGGSEALGDDMSFDETARIDAAKEILDAVGWHFELDGHGRGTIAKDGDPDAMAALWTYRDGDGSVMLPEITDDMGLSDIPNVVRVVSSASGRAPVVGEARNDDATSPTSTVALGCVNELVETNPSGLSENPTAAQCAVFARRLLREKSRVARETTISHGYTPPRLHQCVAIDYRKAGVRTRGIVTKQVVSIGTDFRVTDTVSRYIDYWSGR